MQQNIYRRSQSRLHVLRSFVSASGESWASWKGSINAKFMISRVGHKNALLIPFLESRQMLMSSVVGAAIMLHRTTARHNTCRRQGQNNAACTCREVDLGMRAVLCRGTKYSWTIIVDTTLYSLVYMLRKAGEGSLTQCHCRFTA